jgi:type IV secretion system protein TrbL
MAKFVRTAARFQLLMMVLMLALPLIAGAQTSLPTTGGDGVGFNGAGPGTIVNYFANGTNQWISALRPVAQALFWTLAGIDLTWTCITLVLQHSELQGWMAGFIRKILTIGFFAVLLDQGASWISAIVNFFINLGGTAGGMSVSSLSASDIMGAGVQLAGHMLKSAASTAAAGAVTNPVSLLVSGVSSLAPALILALGAFLIVIAYVVIALHFVMSMVEAYVVVGAGYIFLGFGGSRWTVPYTEKYMGMVVSAGVRIMVLELLIGLGKTLYTAWVTTADAIASTPDVLDGGSFGNGWTGVQSEFGLVASILIYALLCWTIPQIAANVASGGLSMSGGDALSAGAAAGSAAFAGAQFGSNSSPSNAGFAQDVQQIAQAAAMKGAELGVTVGAALVTGGAGGAVTGAADALGSAGGINGAMSATDAAVAMTPEAPASLGSSNGVGDGAQVEPPDSLVNGGSGDSGDSSDKAQGAKLPGGDSPADGSAQGASSGDSTDAAAHADAEEGRPDRGADAKAEKAAAAEDKDTNVEASRANATPSVDQAQVQTQDAIRNAGVQARLDALASGQSPQQAVQAEKDAMQKARNAIGMSRKVGDLVKDLESALNKMPEDGGRMGGTTPKVDHGE